MILTTATKEFMCAKCDNIINKKDDYFRKNSYRGSGVPFCLKCTLFEIKAELFRDLKK